MCIVKLDDEPENEIDNYGNLVREDYDEQPLDSDSGTGVKKFIEEFTVDDASKLARTSEIEPQGDSNLYHCSECNINFLSIQDHVKSCHADQEVVFQVCQKQSFYYTILYLCLN